MKLTVAETARLLAVPEQEVYEWMRDRGLPHVKIQERYFVHRARLHQWAREHYIHLHPDVFGEATTGPNAFSAELADALHNGGLHRLPMPGTERDGVVATLDALRSSFIDREVLCEVMQARQDLGLVIDREGLALQRLGEPILVAGVPALHLFVFEPGWKLGDRRVCRLFVLVTPTVRVHQRLLAELDAMLHQPGFREAVVCAETGQQLEAVARQTAIPAPSAAAK